MAESALTLDFRGGKEGVYHDLPDRTYRLAPGVSNSMLKHIAADGEEPGSPAHFIRALQEPPADTDALFFGRMVHSKILTPQEPLPGIIQIPETYPAPASHADVKKGTIQAGDPLKWSSHAKACKEWLAAQESAGIRPMSAEQIQNLDGVVSALLNNPTTQLAFKEGCAEVSCFKEYWRNDRMVMRKMRADWISPGPAMVDIKSCQDARAIDFDSVIFKRRYYVQAAYYLDIWNDLHPDDQKTHFVFIAVEKFAPYAIQIHDLDPGDIESGRREYRRNLNLILECMASGSWPGYPDGIQRIKMRVPYNRGKMVLEE